MKEWMKRQYDYHSWANEKLLRHMVELPEEIFTKKTELGFASIAEVVGHLAAAEDVWLARLKGETPPPLTPKPFQSAEEALRYMSAQQKRIRDYFLQVQDLENIIHYSNTKGQAFSNTIIDIVQHIVNHGTYHRGNVTTMLRFHGHPGIVTDFIAFARSTS